MNIALLPFLLFFAFSAKGNSFERKVTLDWEPIEEALSYDFEVGEVGQKKPLQTGQELKQNSWSGVLRPGKYWMRVRARDDRNVPTEWSDPHEIQIKLPKVEGLKPLAEEALPSSAQEKKSVLFEWREVPGAHSYSLYIENDRKQAVETKRVTGTKAEVELSTSMGYRWFVQALDHEGRTGERETAFSSFTLLGDPAPPPELSRPETPYVRRIDVTKPKGTTALHVQVQRFDPNKKDWELIKEWRQVKGTQIPFLKAWPGGRYQLRVRTEIKYRPLSSPAEISFDVFEGERSLAAENKALIRKAIDRTEGWFLQGHYVVTQTRYEGVNFESGSRPLFHALSGTAGLRLGHHLEDSPFGFIGGLDYGGLLVQGKNSTFLGLEALAMHRLSLDERSELRSLAGLRRQEVPEAFGSSDGTQIEMNKLSSFELKAGLEYWRSWDRRIGLQAHAFLAMPMQSTSSTGAKISGGQSLQLGVLASRRWKPEMTWLGGYTYSSETYQYPGTNTATQQSGKNSVSLTSHYLHLMVEYDF